MFEKIGRLAETAATNVGVSRRGFLGRLGQGALAVAGVLGGLLVFPKDALARGSVVCCTWKCLHGIKKKRCYAAGTTCAPYLTGYGYSECRLLTETTKPDCSSCT